MLMTDWLYLSQGCHQQAEDMELPKAIASLITINWFN